MDPELKGATMSPSGLKAELMASMRDMGTEGSTLVPMSGGLAEDIEVAISMMTLRGRIRFPVGDTTTIMVTGTPVMVIPVITAMVIDIMATANSTVMRHPSSMMTTISMTTISRFPMGRALDLGKAPDQGMMASEVMVGIGIEVIAITLGVEMSISTVEASTTITHVLRLTTGLISKVTTIIHHGQGLNTLAIDAPTMKSWACLKVWTKRDKAAKIARVKAHPDKNLRADMSADEKQRINDEAARIGEAADILTNPRKRAQYDMELRTGQ